MNIKRNGIKRVSLIMCFVMIFTLVPWHLTYAETEPEGQEAIQDELSEDPAGDQTEPKDAPEPLEIPDPVTEDVTEGNAVKEESTLDSTTFDLGDNEKMLVMYGQDVRFEDENGELVDYDPELIEVKDKKSSQGRDLSGYRYENKVSDHKGYMPDILSEETPVLMESENASIGLVRKSISG